MIAARPISRYLGIVVLLAMAGFASVGFYTIRRDVENLREISQDNTQWSASQMELELLRFRLSLEQLRNQPSAETLDNMHERFDILWSRVFMMGHGHVGESLLHYDGQHGSVARIADYLKEIDPKLAELDPVRDRDLMASVEHKLGSFQDELREYTLRVMRADGAAGALVRARIQSSARTTAVISVAAVLLSVLALGLILRETRRQRQIAEMSRHAAEQAELASRAKSRFLTMMSHELRNPLNGVLGPLALLGQSDIPARQQRLISQAQQSGHSMLQLLSGLLDYGEMQDGRFQFRIEPFRVAVLADAVRDALRAEGAGGVTVTVAPCVPERIHGDPDRLRQAFVHLTLYVLEGRDSEAAAVRFTHDGSNLVGEIAVDVPGEAIDWKLDLLMGLSELAPDQVTAEALRPLIARGLISAGGGILGLVEVEGHPRMIRVTIPAQPVRYEQIRVRLETKSAALATIYQAALRSERIAFVQPEDTGRTDIVLVDSTSVGEAPLMSTLRGRFPGALFVSLGDPQTPDLFDDIVATPSDMTRLRNTILGGLAS
ncbi:MAG: histidine kinase dimerization/phospho-acceptor domain-containing protein [Amaricoccus sp.]